MNLPKIPLIQKVRYWLERLLLGGVIFRVVFIGCGISFVSLIGGNLVWFISPHKDRGYGDTLWWAFLQLTDPGYLGDETDPFRRVIYTLLVVLGLATFVGALVATITQWLNQKIKFVERGTTPVPWHGHVLVLGWTTRTPFMLEEILLANERILGYLARLRLKTLKICVLTDLVNSRLNIFDPNQSYWIR